MKVHREATLPTGFLQDARLSYRARGLLAELLLRPDDWANSVDDLVCHAKQERTGAVSEGRAAMRAALAELEDCGYIVRTQYRERGRFVASFDVFPEPTEHRLAPEAVKLSFRRRAYVYRHWDETGRLLYVGVTEQFHDRQRIHRKNSPWMAFVAKITKEAYDTRVEAELAESRAIAHEAPVFNVAGNEDAVAQRRLSEYLAEHRRANLLAPAVSRG